MLTHALCLSELVVAYALVHASLSSTDTGRSRSTSSEFPAYPLAQSVALVVLVFACLAMMLAAHCYDRIKRHTRRYLAHDLATSRRVIPAVAPAVARTGWIVRTRFGTLVARPAVHRSNLWGKTSCETVAMLQPAWQPRPSCSVTCEHSP